MTNTQKENLTDRNWDKAKILPDYIFEALHKPGRAINPIFIVATTDPDGKPRTAPFGSMRAINPGLLRFACNQYHDTYANVIREKYANAAVLSPSDISVSISGSVKTVKEKINIDEKYAMMELVIDEVKNDMAKHGQIESAIQFAPFKEYEHFYLGIVAEIEDIG